MLPAVETEMVGSSNSSSGCGYQSSRLKAAVAAWEIPALMKQQWSNVLTRNNGGSCTSYVRGRFGQ